VDDVEIPALARGHQDRRAAVETIFDILTSRLATTRQAGHAGAKQLCLTGSGWRSPGIAVAVLCVSGPRRRAPLV
jgi:hypothetical protein